MQIIRQKTKIINIGNIAIGGQNPIAVQSMTNTKTSNVTATAQQINQLAAAGADIVRVTVNDEPAAGALAKIIRNAPIPVAADIHFNHILALKAIDAGAAKIRINPGNIGSTERIKQVLKAAKENKIPIRIGVNSGSLEKDILEKHGSPTAQALFESAMRHIQIANNFDFDDIIVAVKASSVRTTIDAYRLLSKATNYPLHLGVTEAGSVFAGTIKSTVALSILLAEGIGDTIRISLNGDPVKEIEAGIELLAALGLRHKSVELIACPTCGRIEIDTIEIVEILEPILNKIKTKRKITVAIMGCVVNGPGEAKHADIAVACGKKEALLFVGGIEKKRLAPNEIIENVLKEVNEMVAN